MASTLPVITELDAARIRGISGDLIDWVRSETDVVPGHRIAPDVVTLGSRVSFREVDSREVHCVTVVHPVDASIAERRISVLSPVGRALLGRRVGEVTQVAVPGGGARGIHVLEMHYQPEAAGVPLP